MKIIAKVIDVEERIHKDKPVADITLKSGSEVFQFTLWNNEFQKGTHTKFQKCFGQEVITDVETEEFRGKIQHKFSMGGDVRPYNPSPVQAAKAS